MKIRRFRVKVNFRSLRLYLGYSFNLKFWKHYLININIIYTIIFNHN
jgi:hypothetical protein